MDRLFQDDHGIVSDLEGVRVSSASAVVAADDQNVIVLWLEDHTPSSWFRLFIDGIYCGIDRYRRCEIDEDLDEGCEAVNHDAFFSGQKLRRAHVGTRGEGDDTVIELRIELENNAAAILSFHSDSEYCRLNLVPE